MEAQKPARLNALTGLRCFAAVNIVLFHFSNPQWFGFLAPVVDAGYVSVSYFILLSGFVLGYNYNARARAGELDRLRFYEARFTRLYPIYLLSLFLSWRMVVPEYGAHAQPVYWNYTALTPQHGMFWVGMVLIAAVPPPVDIILLGNLLRTEKTSIFTGLAGAYLGALLIIPLIGLGFFKYILPNYWNIILIVLGLILLPLALSRIAVEKTWDKIIEPYEETIIDYCSFIVFYTITASSRNLLINWSSDLFIIASIAFVSTFFFAFAIRKIGIYFKYFKFQVKRIVYG